MRTPIRGHRRGGVTLAEMVITSAVSLIVLLAIMNIFSFILGQCGVRASAGMSRQQANLAMEQIERDVQNATSFSAQNTAGGASSGNTLFVLVMPKASDADGNYIPKRNASGNLTFAPGQQIGFYLSDESGKVSVRGGTVLWRAVRGAGQTSISAWKPDADWALYDNDRPRYPGIEAFSISSSGGTAPLVQATLVLSAREEGASSRTRVSRQIYLANNDAGLGSG